jgi:hypothetical protein
VFIIFITGGYDGYRDIFGLILFIFLGSIAEGYDKECHIGKSTELGHENPVMRLARRISPRL